MSNIDYAKYVPAARHKVPVEVLQNHITEFVEYVNSIVETVDQGNGNLSEETIAKMSDLNVYSQISKNIIKSIKNYTEYDLVYNDDLVKGKITYEQYQDICILDSLKRDLTNPKTKSNIPRVRKIEADFLKANILHFEKLVPVFKEK